MSSGFKLKFHESNRVVNVFFVLWHCTFEEVSLAETGNTTVNKTNWETQVHTRNKAVEKDYEQPPINTKISAWNLNDFPVFSSCWLGYLYFFSLLYAQEWTQQVSHLNYVPTDKVYFYLFTIYFYHCVILEFFCRQRGPNMCFCSHLSLVLCLEMSK